jgi:hypothetical protein
LFDAKHGEGDIKVDLGNNILFDAKYIAKMELNKFTKDA